MSADGPRDVPPDRSHRQAWWERFELGRFVHAALVSKVPRDHLETAAAFRRRRTVVALSWWWVRPCSGCR